jgi:Protein of unknown function (DUF3179)
LTGRRVLLLVAAFFSAACFSHHYKSKPRVAVVGNDPIVQMTAPMPSLEAPRFVPLSRHSDPPFADERVLGLALGDGAPRMYPVGILDTYEVIDDEAGGTPFVVTRCPLTDLVAVFDRRLGGRTLTFENSGALWRDMLVFRDRETGSYWTPSTGRAIAGPLAGETLALLPGPVTTANAWEELQPATGCLETGELTAVPLQMRLYAASRWQGVSGEETRRPPFAAKQRVFYLQDGDEALAFTAAQIRERRTVSASLAGRPIAIEWDAALRAPRAWTPSADARRELPVVPIYWFAVLRHFGTVRTLDR